MTRQCSAELLVDALVPAVRLAKEAGVLPGRPTLVRAVEELAGRRGSGKPILVLLGVLRECLGDLCAILLEGRRQLRVVLVLHILSERLQVAEFVDRRVGELAPEPLENERFERWNKLLCRKSHWTHLLLCPVGLFICLCNFIIKLIICQIEFFAVKSR